MANLFRNVPSLIPKIMPDERPGPLSRTLSPYIRKSIVYSFSDFLIAFFSYYFCSFNHILLSVQFSSVTQSCPTLCNPMDGNTPGLPVHYKLLEFTQTHVYWVSDIIQISHPLSSPSLPTFTLSQHQGLFKWIISLQQVAKVVEFQLQHQSFQWIFRTDFL